MAETLKPCPFCGGEPVVCGYPDEFMVYVKCSKCGAMSGLVQATEEKAAENWNRRAERTCRIVSAKEAGRAGLLPGLRGEDVRWI